MMWVVRPAIEDALSPTTYLATASSLYDHSEEAVPGNSKLSSVFRQIGEPCAGVSRL